MTAANRKEFVLNGVAEVPPAANRKEFVLNGVAEVPPAASKLGPDENEGFARSRDRDLEASGPTAARSYRWWSLRPEFFRTAETPSAIRSVRYGFGLVKPDHTRRFLATLDRIDYDQQGHRSRGFNLDVRLFG